MEQLLLNDVEFFVLLKAAGVNHIPYFKTSAEYGKTEVPYTIHEMVRKGILSLEEDDKLQVNKPYLQIIKAIKNQKAILMIQSGEEMMDTKYIFISNSLILIQNNKHMDNGILVEEISIEELKELIYDVISSDNIWDCPDDLLFLSPEDEEGICSSYITLGKKCFDSAMEECIKWEFYRGRYQPYVKEINQTSIEYRSRKEWSIENLLTRINEMREEKKNDNG